jgi:urease accessory protein
MKQWSPSLAQTSRRCTAPLLTVGLCGWPAVAWAHVERGQAQAAGLLTGLAHPVSGLDHVLAMLAVGLWGAQLGAPAVWLLPVAFPMMMACGGMVGLMGLGVPGVEGGIALSAIMLGAMVLLEARPPLWLAALLVGFFAIFHGHAHGTELPEGASGLLYSIGFVSATGSLHGAGIAIGLLHRWPAASPCGLGAPRSPWRAYVSCGGPWGEPQRYPYAACAVSPS